MRVLLILGICLLSFGLRADYYVDPSGSDTNSGSISAPFATVHKAASVATNGNSVIINAGTYTGSELDFTNSGGTSTPITFTANGEAILQFDCDVTAGRSNIVFSGLTWQGYAVAALWLRRDTKYVTITNCTIRDSQFGSTSAGIFMDGPPGGNVVPEACSSYNTIVSNSFLRLTNVTALNIQGVGHLVYGNTWSNLYASDAMRIFGSNTVVRANLFYGVGELAGYGNHPDIMQTFGHLGMWVVDFVFERNHVKNSAVQLLQSQQDIVLGTNLWGITFRNNVFEDSNMQCSISIPNVRFYNNTFYRCSNGGALLGYTYYDPNASNWRGAAYGGQVWNNVFYECSGAYNENISAPGQGALTPENAGGGGRTGYGYGRFYSDSGVYTIVGVYSNLSGNIIYGTLYDARNGTDVYHVTNTFGGGTFSNSITSVDGQAGYSASEQSGMVNAKMWGFKIRTDTFTDGEISGALTNYVPSPAQNLLADWNYAGGINGATFPSVNETNGVNGGDPGFVNAAASDFRIGSGSVLFGAATNLATIFTTDKDGVARGSTWDIGAYEYEAAAPASSVLNANTLTVHGQAVIGP